MWRTALLTVFISAVSAPIAFAGDHDGGEGIYGPTDDKVVTYTGFILIAAFPLLILILTLIQSALDRRKDRRLAAAKARRERADLRGGW
jgi:membrane protease YdiL (CAAX protease family)